MLKRKRRPSVRRAIVPVQEGVLAPEADNNKYTLPTTWVSERQVLKILQKTPREHVFTRPAKGGGTWEYVTGVYVEKVLNYVFGWLWDFEIIKQEVIGKQVITLGKLTVKDGKGNSIVKMQNGRADIKYKKNSDEPLDLGNDYKASATDCLKKCASKFGIASDIYGKEEFKEIGKPIDQSPPAGLAVNNEAVKPLDIKPLESLFLLAREFGATEGMETVFIQEVLERNIEWAGLDAKGVSIIKTQLMSKLTPR